MRVLHIIPSVSQVRGGPSRVVLDIVYELQQLGIDAEIATTNDNGDDILDVPLQKQVLHGNVPTSFFPRFSPPLKTFREFAFSGAFTTWLLNNIFNYNLIHIHALFSYTSTVAMAIARLKGVPYIVTPHGLLCHWSLQQSASKKKTYLHLIERSNLDHSRAIHLTSHQEEQDVSSLQLKAPTFILPLGLNHIPPRITDASLQLRQLLNCPHDEPIILFLSRIHHKKGLDYLIPALSQLTDQRFTFVIAGSGTPEYESEIEALLIKFGIRSRTRLIGFVEGEKKNLLIQGANLLALTSHSENFGVAILEALAVGTPVLVTPGVALSSVVQQYDFGYVPNLEITAIKDSLDEHLSRPEQAKIKGDRARQFILENYTWDKIAAQMIEIYQSILNRQPLMFSLH